MDIVISPDEGYQLGAPSGDGVQTGVLERDAGQQHAEPRGQAQDLVDELAGHRARHVQHEYRRQTAAGHGHQLRRHVHVQQ